MKKLKIVSLIGIFCFSVMASRAAFLDTHPNALVAYSLRKISHSYNGPILQVRRTSDNQIRDISFNASGLLDTSDLISFVGSSNGEVLKWYSQIQNHPALIPSDSHLPPLIVENGLLVQDSNGNPRLKFFRNDSLKTENPGYPFDIDDSNLTVHIVVESEHLPSYVTVFQITGDKRANETLTFAASDKYRLRHPGDGFADAFSGRLSTDWNILTVAVSMTSAQLYENHNRSADSEVSPIQSFERKIILGASGKKSSGAWSGYIGEFLIYPYTNDLNTIRSRVDSMNAYWKTGPTNYNPQALLPQRYDYQIQLYDWLETVTIQDVTLPQGTLQWDGSYSNVDSLSDLWMYFVPDKVATISRVTRHEPKWLVLNDGNGSGIEGTGQVRIMHTTGYSDNDKSWGNEPAHWYSIDIPMADGSNGNPYYKQRALCMRALVITAVDMLMYDEKMEGGGSHAWNDIHGKAMFSWVDAVYICEEEINELSKSLPFDLMTAFEKVLNRNMEISIESGVRDSNTNMDMFPVHGAAKIAKYSKDPNLRDTALRLAKRLLLGFADGELFNRHDPHIGTFFPAGYIGEKNTAEGFYNGESFYHMVGSLAFTKGISGWEWMEEVVRRMALWRYYQAYSQVNSVAYEGPSGYSARTSANALTGQNSASWRDITAAAMIPEALPLLNGFKFGRLRFPEQQDMIEGIHREIQRMNRDFGTTDTTTPPTWKGWSPWPKQIPYLPPKGWFSYLRNLIDANDEKIILPIDKPDHSYNIAFGGEPTGMEFWSYRNQNDSRDFAFYVEADSQQGPYGAWYGGKLEAFWTKQTGPMILNRKSKSGCDGKSELSSCWDLIDIWGAHHVWGKDEHGRGFSPVHLKGTNIDRPVKYTPEQSPVAVEITTTFNDPNALKNGEEKPDVIEGELSVKNRFEAVNNGIFITHSVLSDQTDEMNELWVSLPVFIGNKDTDEVSIEYSDGATWKPLTTSIKSTVRLRLGRDNDGMKYVYVNFITPQRVRLSSKEWKDPYQTDTRIRNIHIDLHGNPGAAKNIPSEIKIQYGINTTMDPGRQIISAYAGENKSIPFQHDMTLEGIVYRGGENFESPNLDYNWTLLSGPNTVHIQFPTDRATQVSFNEGGEYLFQFSVEFEGNNYSDVIQINMAAAGQELLEVPKFINAFNPKKGPLQIPIGVSQPDRVTINIYNQRGELITNLVNEIRSRGIHFIPWEATDMASGVYLISIQIGPEKSLRKCVLLK